MKIYNTFLCLFFMVSIFVNGQNSTEWSPVIINEVGLMPQTNQRFIELLVLGDIENPNSPVNLEGWLIDNYSNDLANDDGIIRLGADFSSLNPGTIILIYDEDNIAPSIDPQASGFNEELGLIQYSIQSSAIENLKYSSYLSGNIQNAKSNSWQAIFPFSNLSDGLYIMDATNRMRRGVTWGTPGNPPNTTLTPGGVVPLPPILPGTPVVYADKFCVESVEYTDGYVATPGRPNSYENKVLVNAARSGMQENLNISLVCEQIQASNENNGIGKVTISGGVGPFQLEWSGPNEETGTQNQIWTIYEISDLAPGEYNITVTDSRECHQVCFFSIDKLEDEPILCEETCTEIGNDLSDYPNYCSFIWSTTDGLLNPESSISEACPNVSTTYELSISNNNGEILDILIYEVVIARPKDLIIEPDFEILDCNSGTIDLFATNGFGSDYIWKNNNVLIPDVNSNSLSVNSSGKYTCEVQLDECMISSNSTILKSNDYYGNLQALLSNGYIDLGYGFTIGEEITLKKNKIENDIIVDNFNKFLVFPNQEIDLELALSDDLFELIEEDCGASIIIDDGNKLCDMILQVSYESLINHSPSLGFHLVILEDDDLNGKLLVKVFGTCTPEEQPKYSAISFEQQSLNCNSSIEEFKENLETAETLLIQNGYESIFERIDILRGIYYGTEWSVDFSVENSQTRNNLFNGYCHDILSPDDPRPILGQALFNDLFQCAEIRGPGIGIDFGHLIIGLDARSTTMSNVQIPIHSGSGLELVTWLGDLGAAAGTLAKRRVSSPNLRAMTMFTGASSFGSFVNLEGDIAAAVIGWDGDVPLISAYPDFSNTDNLADIFTNYFCPNPYEGSQFQNRSRLFLEFLGGEFDSKNNLMNKEYLVTQTSERLAPFGELYLTNRLIQTGEFDLALMKESTRHLQGASLEIATIFIETLESEVTLMNKKITVQGNGPDPTPPDSPYIKWSTMKTTSNWINWIDEKINN